MMGGHRGLLEQEARKPRSLRKTLGRLAGYFKPYWLVLIGVLFLMVLNAWTQVITPELTGQAVDCYLTPGAISEVQVVMGAPAGETSAEPATNASQNCLAGRAGRPVRRQRPTSTRCCALCWY